MKILIEDDLFEIVSRVKSIDDGYFILYDDSKNKFELHYKYQYNSYCFTSPYDVLDNRFIDLLYKTNIKNIDDILTDIDNNNANIEKQHDDTRNNQNKYMLNEIYKFANNSSKSIDANLAFKNHWR